MFLFLSVTMHSHKKCGTHSHFVHVQDVACVIRNLFYVALARTQNEVASVSDAFVLDITLLRV